jgi:hypothetical protein
MFRMITKTFAVLLPVFWLASPLAMAQTGGGAPGAGTGAPGSPGGSGSMSPGPSHPSTPGTLPRTPGQPSPGDTLGRPGDPGSPPGMPDPANPTRRIPEPPDISPRPETSGERELRQQGDTPRTTPDAAPQRRSGMETPSSPGMSGPDTAETSRPRPR